MRTYHLGCQSAGAGEYAYTLHSLHQVVSCVNMLKNQYRAVSIALMVVVDNGQPMSIMSWVSKPKGTAWVHYTLISKPSGKKHPYMGQSSDVIELMGKATKLPGHRNVIWMWSKGKEPIIIFDSQFDRL